MIKAVTARRIFVLISPSRQLFLREHDALEGKTPAEAAGIKIEGRNKWVTVIQNASYYS